MSTNKIFNKIMLDITEFNNINCIELLYKLDFYLDKTQEELINKFKGRDAYYWSNNGVSFIKELYKEYIINLSSQIEDNNKSYQTFLGDKIEEIHFDLKSKNTISMSDIMKIKKRVMLLNTSSNIKIKNFNKELMQDLLINMYKRLLQSFCNEHFNDTLENIDNDYEQFEELYKLGYVTKKISDDNILYTFIEEDNTSEIEIVENNEIYEKFKYQNIYCYKEMCKLAYDNGYSHKWSNGSHNIYRHNITNKIIVIPSHDLGFGLSRKIQKQIVANAN